MGFVLVEKNIALFEHEEIYIYIYFGNPQPLPTALQQKISLANKEGPG